jgi:hypothetical protein
MTERILDIEQAAAETPWSTSTLYRLAPKPESPFKKIQGRWVAVESDLIAFVRNAPKPKSRQPAEHPIPRPRCRRQSSFGAKVSQLEKGRA